MIAAIMLAGTLACTRLLTLSSVALGYTDPAPQGAASRPKAQELTVQPGDFIEIHPDGSAIGILGELDPLDSDHRLRAFEIANTTGRRISELTVRYIPHPWLRLLAAPPDRAVAPPTPLLPGDRLPELYPGQRFTLYADVDPGACPPGTIEASVEVDHSGAADPVLRLRLRGSVRTLATVSPRTLIFSRSGGRGIESRTFTVRLDSRLMGAGIEPQLVCTYPYVRLQRVATAGAAARSAGLLANPEPATTSFAYRADLLPSAPAGRFVGNILLCRRAGVTDIDGALVARALSTATLTVVGEVTGGIRVVPAALDFGAVSGEASRSVWLTAAKGSDLSSITLHCASTRVAARLYPEEPVRMGTGEARRRLEVILRPASAGGRLLTTVTVIAATNECLVIPISARFSDARRKDGPH